MLSTRSRVLCWSSRRQQPAVSPVSTQHWSQDSGWPGPPPGVASRQVACLWGKFPGSSSPLAVLFPLLIEFLGLRISSVLLAFHSHADGWWNGKRAFAWICQQGETWPRVLDPGTVFPICGGRQPEGCAYRKGFWILGRAGGQMSSSKSLPQSEIREDFPAWKQLLKLRLELCDGPF